MRSIRKSSKLPDFSIQDFYSMVPAVLWRGFKLEGVAFWALCVYLFIEYVRPDIIYPALAFLPWSKLALLTALVGIFMDKSVKWVKSSATLSLILFFTIVYLSAIYSFMPEVSMRFITIPINWVLVYFLIISIVNSEKRFFLFLLVYFLVNFKMSQFGFRAFIARGFTFTFWGVSGSPGWFENAGDLGVQMTIFTPMCLVFVYHLKQYWGKWKRYLLYLLPVTGLFTLAAASSRGALLGLVCIGVWYLLKSRLGIKAILGMVVVSALLYQVLPEEMLNKFKSSGEDATSVSRLALWETGIDVAIENPTLGVGFENWFEYCWANNQTGIGRGQWCLDLHNTYIEAAAETGLFSFALYVLLILKVFAINARTRANARKIDNKFIYYMTHGMDAGMIGYMVSSAFVSVLFYPIFWVQLAMTVALHGIARTQLEAVGVSEEADGLSVRRRPLRATASRMNKQRN